MAQRPPSRSHPNSANCDKSALTIVGAADETLFPKEWPVVCLRESMRSVFEEWNWRPIEEAPLEQPVDVLVADFCGSTYRLQYPCRRTSEGWISAIGTRLTVTPVRWLPIKRNSVT
jgi:hypothetical protein